MAMNSITKRKEELAVAAMEKQLPPQAPPPAPYVDETPRTPIFQTAHQKRMRMLNRLKSTGLLAQHSLMSLDPHDTSATLWSSENTERILSSADKLLQESPDITPEAPRKSPDITSEAPRKDDRLLTPDCLTVDTSLVLQTAKSTLSSAALLLRSEPNSAELKETPPKKVKIIDPEQTDKLLSESPEPPEIVDTPELHTPLQPSPESNQKPGSGGSNRRNQQWHNWYHQHAQGYYQGYGHQQWNYNQHQYYGGGYQGGGWGASQGGNWGGTQAGWSKSGGWK